ncbi:hypothetical protein DSO57_1001893 [Entomophthora muscae]|uniref:Uncharacterized protein n=1 Tax=Entomophthora muscae TaxID=34485 RepID=A0ACC2TJT7_9FUNG|nr:hypothetical protein DSO57_1001893 [Entomophthora muscae]
MDEEKIQYTFKSLVGDLRSEVSHFGNFEYEGLESYFVTDSPNAEASSNILSKREFLFQGSDTQKDVSASFLRLRRLQDQTQDLLNHPKAIPNELDMLSTKINEIFALTEDRLKSLNP